MFNNYKGSTPRYNQQPNNRGRAAGNISSLPKPVQAKELPADYVDEAERVIQQPVEGKVISTNKIRNLLSFTACIYDKENLRNSPEISEESGMALARMRIRTVYECGRDKDVKDFVMKAQLLEYLKGLKKDRKKVINFCHYMEALVAYHRYYNGEGKD